MYRSDLEQVLPVFAIAMLLAAAGPPTTKPSAIADVATSELLQTIVPWNGTVPLNESERSVDDARRLSALDELNRRLSKNALSGAELDTVLTQCYRGDEIAPPMSKAWRDKYLWLLEHYWQASSAVRPVEDKAFEIPFDANIRTDIMLWGAPEEWPAMTEVPVLLSIRAAWRPSLGCIVRAIAELPGAAATCGVSTEDLYLMIPPLAAGRHEISILIEMYRRDDHGIDRLLQSRKLPLSLRAVASPVKLVGFESREVADAIRKNLRPHLLQLTPVDRAAPRDACRYSLMLNWDANWVSAFAKQDTAFGVIVELFDSDENLRLRAFYGRFGDSSRHWDEPVLILNSKDLERPWTVRVRDFPAMALAMVREEITDEARAQPEQKARYWVGDVQMPVRTNQD